MLRRRSIRTKLVYALGVLTLIFCFLAFSAIWGVRQYRELAESVRQQAVEIPYANSLLRYAEDIRRSHERLAKLRNRPGMLETFSLTSSDIVIENSTIDISLLEIGMTLERYNHKINQSSEQSRMLVDRSLEQQSLWEIQEAKELIDKLMLSGDLMTREGDQRFASLANDLVARAQAHQDLIHSEMTRFSENVNGQYDRFIWFNVVCMIAAAVLVSLLYFSFKSLVAQPFRTLLDGSRLVASGQYGHRIDLGTSDELSELANAMNSMSTKFRDVYERQKESNQELDRQVRLRTREVIQNEQLASVGFLAAGVAHEINNPLASIAWSAESLQSDLNDLPQFGDENAARSQYKQELQSNLQRIQDEAYRCKGITERLLDFSRLGDVSRSSTNLAELVERVVSIVSNLGKYKCKTLRMHCDKNVFAHINSQEIQQVVLNLVTNALESVDSDGAVDVVVKNRGPVAHISVRDNGCGMSQEVLDHLFEPFFTRRKDGTGTGLGLSITYRIVSQHHGSLTASSDGEGKGSRLELSLPVHAVTDEKSVETPTSIGWNDDVKAVA